jgi:hypothetical protein
MVVEKTLWFTSTMSSDLLSGPGHSHTAFAGLYECQLKENEGACVEPTLIVDKWDINGTHHKGLDLMDVSKYWNIIILHCFLFASTNSEF